VTSISSVSITTDAIETTTLADDYRTFLPGLHDGGEVTVAGYFTGSDTGQNALQTAQDARTVGAYSVVYPTGIGKTWAFNGFVTNFSVLDATNDDPVGFEVTIKISGKPTLATSV
jgi:hypothetical protein